MRCKSCGWENPAEAQKCAKCNAPLAGSMVGNAQPSGFSESARPLKATVRENFSSAPQPQQMADHYVCQCGYHVPNGANVCPACGTLVGAAQPQAAPQQMQRQGNPIVGGTVIGGFGIGVGAELGNTFTLKPIPFQNEQVQYQPITFTGDSVVLNRQNTESTNNTITSKEQAVIVHKNDGWYIDNHSAGKTTYIQVTHEMKINPGDIIILGNRAFEFGKL
ncbi:MAG: FHA domain-containing protein [Salinivirgaceae bacterium]|nr:FHA domain-containing protein [Salinivirgaceae bacterium]